MFKFLFEIHAKERLHWTNTNQNYETSGNICYMRTNIQTRSLQCPFTKWTSCKRRLYKYGPRAKYFPLTPCLNHPVGGNFIKEATWNNMHTERINIPTFPVCNEECILNVAKTTLLIWEVNYQVWISVGKLSSRTEVIRSFS